MSASERLFSLVIATMALAALVGLAWGSYGWFGDPVDLVPAVSSASRAKTNDSISRYAVVSVPEVAKRLGISEATVKYSERRALAKLRSKPELKQAWLELLSCHQRFTYDPFYQVWMFSVQSET